VHDILSIAGKAEIDVAGHEKGRAGGPPVFESFD
jgi:hypothetical protein